MTEDIKIFVLFTVSAQKLVLDIPQSRREVNIVFMRIFKAFYLIPEGIHLLLAEGADFLNRRRFIHALALLKHRDKKLFYIIILNHLALPGMLRIENLIGSAVGDGFAV